MSDSSTDELRKVLNERDIELLTDRFLSALNDMQSEESDPLELSHVYEKMGLGAYNLSLAMQFIIQEYLIPRQAVDVIDNKVKITRKGKLVSAKITKADRESVEETLQKLTSALQANAPKTETVIQSKVMSMSIKKFKSLNDTKTLTIKPITLIFGPNSSGKTALLQSILILKQTLEEGNIRDAMILNGKHANVGSFKDAAYLHNSSESIEISLGLNNYNEPHEPAPVPIMSFKIGYDAVGKRPVLNSIEFNIDIEKNVRIVNETIQFKTGSQKYEYKQFNFEELEKINFLYIPTHSFIQSIKNYLAARSAIRTSRERKREYEASKTQN